MGVLNEQITGTGPTAAVGIHGMANALIVGGTGTVEIEKSFDKGATWHTLSRDSTGAAASYSTSGGSVAFNGTINEPEFGVQYRFNCTAYTSGTITVHLGSR